MKVKISNNSNCFYYPDIMVGCDDNDNEDEYFITSPKIIVEILSKSTRKMDSTTKMINYFTNP
jgi:Uma2 family endonuclease